MRRFGRFLLANPSLIPATFSAIAAFLSFGVAYQVREASLQAAVLTAQANTLSTFARDAGRTMGALEGVLFITDMHLDLLRQQTEQKLLVIRNNGRGSMPFSLDYFSQDATRKLIAYTEAIAEHKSSAARLILFFPEDISQRLALHLPKEMGEIIDVWNPLQNVASDPLPQSIAEARARLGVIADLREKVMQSKQRASQVNMQIQADVLSLRRWAKIEISPLVR